MLVLCLFVLTLPIASCGETLTPEASISEYNLVEKARERNACNPTPRERRANAVCSLFVELADGRLIHLIQVRHGVPYIEEFPGGIRWRYGEWYDSPNSDRRFARRSYVGPHEPAYDQLWYRFFDEERTRDTNA